MSTELPGRHEAGILADRRVNKIGLQWHGKYVVVSVAF